MAERIGSILHGAYGDYYEQAICLKALKRARPELSLVLFFATASRMRELRVLDFGFADELHLAVDLPRVGVDRFLQFQVKDPELQADILAGLDSGLRNRIDDGVNRKPWSRLRSLNLRDPAVHIRLSEEGRRRLPQVLSEEGLASDIFATRPTVGFLWRYRQRGGAIAPWLQPPEAAVLATKSELLRRLQEQSGDGFQNLGTPQA